MNTNGTAQTNRTNNAAYDEYPNWWPDTSRITFDSNRNDGFFQIYRMLADGSNVQRETNSGGNDEKGSISPQQNVGILWMRDIERRFRDLHVDGRPHVQQRRRRVPGLAGHQQQLRAAVQRVRP